MVEKRLKKLSPDFSFFFRFMLIYNSMVFRFNLSENLYQLEIASAVELLILSVLFSPSRPTLERV